MKTSAMSSIGSVRLICATESDLKWFLGVCGENRSGDENMFLYVFVKRYARKSFICQCVFLSNISVFFSRHFKR